MEFEEVAGQKSTALPGRYGSRVS